MVWYIRSICWWRIIFWCFCVWDVWWICCIMRVCCIWGVVCICVVVWCIRWVVRGWVIIIWCYIIIWVIIICGIKGVGRWGSLVIRRYCICFCLRVSFVSFGIFFIIIRIFNDVFWIELIGVKYYKYGWIVFVVYIRVV